MANRPDGLRADLSRAGSLLAHGECFAAPEILRRVGSLINFKRSHRPGSFGHSGKAAESRVQPRAVLARASRRKAQTNSDQPPAGIALVTPSKVARDRLAFLVDRDFCSLVFAAAHAKETFAAFDHENCARLAQRLDFVPQYGACLDHPSELVLRVDLGRYLFGRVG